jgi:N-acetyltransferase
MSAKKKTQISSPLRQLTLNFGQKSPIITQKTIECKECGMIYNFNDKKDEQLHFKYHSDKENCLKYSDIMVKNEKVVQDYLDGKVIVVENCIDSNQSVNKSLQVLEYVDKQLGINEFDLKEQDFKKRRSLINKNSKFYLFIDKLNKKIVGFCLAEQIENACRINENGYSYDDTKCEENTICGINRIWVADQMRHKKIATRLLDCVCFNFFYYYKLLPNQLAFSDPTPNGRLLAKNYCKCDSFLIYNLNKNFK